MFKKIGAFLVMAWILAACGNNRPTFSLLAEDDIFKQSGDTTSLSKIDILWVVDNSGSMQTSQEAIKNNFNSFIKEFSSPQKNFDYQIAVTTTEAYLANPSLYDWSNPSYARFKDGTDATAHSGIFVITPQTPDIVGTFNINIIQGTWGTGDERGLQSMKETLDSPLNAGFLRDDAFLSVIIVSDEDDISRDGKKSTAYQLSDLHNIQDYVSYLDALTQSSGDNRRYSVSAIVVDSQACKDQLNAEWAKVGYSNVVEIGQRYIDIANATEGVVSSICGDFATALNDISSKVVQAASSLFYLSRTPIPSTITVRINGTLIPSSGWVYDSSSNSVKILAPYTPNPGDNVSIKYDPLKYGS